METPTSHAQDARRCDFCDESVDIPWKCVSCDNVLCLRCGRKHIMENDHRIINLTNPEQGPLLKIKRCEIHKHYDICNFCQDCDKPICAKCLVESHQGHCIQENEKVYEEKIRTLEGYHNVLSSEFWLKISSERNELEKLSFMHYQHHEKEKQKIVNRDKFIKDLITSHTNQLLEELENNSKDIEDKIQNLKSKIEQQILELEKKISFIEENQNSIDLDTVCNINNDLKSFIEDWDKTPNSLPRESFQFVVGGTTLETIEKIVGSLQKCFVAKLVDFEATASYNTGLPTVTAIATSKVDNTIWINSPRESIIRNIEFEAKNAKTLIDLEGIKANGMATTLDGALLFTQSCCSSIKKANTSGEITDFYTFPKKMFQTAQLPIGLHVKRDGQIIVSSIENGDIYNIYNMSKNSRRKVEVLSPEVEKLYIIEFDAEGERIFCMPYKITSTNSGDICVIDWTDPENGRLIVLDYSGAFKWSYAGNPYNTARLFQPHDVVTVSNTFFVISAKENSIHVLNNEGQIIKYQPTRELGFERPYSIEIDHKGKLLVGNNEGEIFVLQIIGC